LQNNKTDILIIGGGIAGCIAAIQLAEFYQVTLIDKLAEPKERIGESLAPAAQRILKQLDLLEGMNEFENSMYLQNLGMQSFWGGNQVQINDHLSNPDGFGRSLNRKAFETYLRESAEKRGVNCYWSCKLLRSEYGAKEWKVSTQYKDSELDFTAKFVIDASGRQAHFARGIGTKREAIDQLMACWMTLPNESENTMSTISASENGWWYSAVIPDNKRVVAFHTDAYLLEPAVFKSVDSMVELAKGNKPIATLLKNNTDELQLQGTVAANSSYLQQSAGNQWAAIGDAALSFDPLSSQGMFNAMASAMQLSELIKNSAVVKQTDAETIDKITKSYQQQTNQIWQRYLKHKDLFYGMEKRWESEPFWSRRK